MANTEQLGSRGEVWLVAQLVLLGLLVFPPGPLEVGAVDPRQDSHGISCWGTDIVIGLFCCKNS
jgi:hypothetical protein